MKYFILAVFTGQIFYSALDLYMTDFGVPFKNWMKESVGGWTGSCSGG
jgi:hypothetical protein